MSQPVRLLYFAWIREQIGCSFEELSLPGEIATVADLIDHLAARGPGYAQAFARRRSVRCAVNQEFASFSDPVSPGDEIGFFPPVTGG
jgi:molybdopterin synthase sulfur carrier subunit